MAISSFRTYLMHKEDSTYKKLVDITSFPDLGSSPNMIETTTLSDHAQTFIPGIVQMGDGLEFSANYDADTYDTLKKLEGKQEDYALWFAGTGDSGATATPSGNNGKFSFTGELTVTVNGGGVDEAVGMTISIAPSTVISFEKGTT